MRSKNIFEKQTLLKSLERLAIFGLGVIAGLLVFHFGSFEFDWKFSVIDFLVVILTFVVTFNLQQILSDRSSDDRVEKDIIIEQSKTLAGILKAIANVLGDGAFGSGDQTVAREMLANLKKLSQELTTLESFVDEASFSINAAKVRCIRAGYLKLKRSATGGGFPTMPVTADELRKGRRLTRELSTMVFHLIFYVNRL